ncbi:MAG: serine hydrolase domain-containing protein [Chitinophagaceae bacterium]
MKNILIASVITSGAFFSTISAIKKPAGDFDLGVTINYNYSKAAALDSILKHYTKEALPGACVAVYSEAEGWWAGAQGYANVETKRPMENFHLQYIQSVSKMYMAIEILQLKEQGKIVLDEPMTKYLPEKYSRYIKNAGAITVRMLLNHASGIPEYNSNPRFLSGVIQHPLDNFSGEDCLESIAGEESRFTPGSKYEYVNTNYLLLSLIGDAITGNHAAYISKHIFNPLGLKNTYYGNGHKYLKGLDVPDSYWDILNVGRPANVTKFQQMTVVSSKGDDGIVCTPVDAVKLLKAVIEGKLLNQESMKEMFDFIKDEKGNKRYGMGMIYFNLNGVTAYGHGGGGVGAGCGLLYIPSHKVYVFFSTNLGVLVDGTLPTKAGEMRDAILATLLK